MRDTKGGGVIGSKLAANQVRDRIRNWFTHETPRDVRDPRDVEVDETIQQRLLELQAYMASAAAADLPDKALHALNYMHAVARSLVELIDVQSALVEKAARSCALTLCILLDIDLQRALSDYAKLKSRDHGDVVLRAKLPLLIAQLLELQSNLAAAASAKLLELTDRGESVGDVDSYYVRAGRFRHFAEESGPKELIDGRTYTRPGAELMHQRMVRRMLGQLERWAAAASWTPTIELGPMPVRFGPTRILQPDLMLWLKPLPERYVYPVPHVPDLVVEVVSSFGHRSDMFDHDDKVRMYQAAGVSEVWVIDPRLELVARYSGEQRTSQHRDEEIARIASILLPGFRLDIGDLRRGCESLPLGATHVVNV